MKFYYEAFTTRGEPKMGEIEAQSEEHAAGKIRNELGLIAREIKAQPFDAKLAHNRAVSPSEARPFDPDNVPIEQPSLRMNPTPPPAAPEAPGAPGAAWAELAEDLTRISDVARQMEEWKKRYEEKGQKADDPAMGGVSWKIYEEDKKKIVSDLIKYALNRAVFHS